MSVTQFNNNLYEKNGCRFFEVSELEAMEDISNTSLLADYFARRRGALLVDVPHLEELDRVDLFSRAMRTSAARGRLIRLSNRRLKMGLSKDMKLKKSWCITAATWLRVKKRSRQLSRCLHAKRSDASELQLWRRGVSLSVEITNA
jgi:hypothetical protein